MVVLTVTDLRERILPDEVNFIGLGLGLLLSLFTPPVDGTARWLAGRLFALLAAAAGAFAWRTR